MPLNKRMNKQAKGDVIMEFEKLKEIIAEVLMLTRTKLQRILHSKMTWTQTPLDVFQIIMGIEDDV